MQPQHIDASSNLHVNSKLFQNAINGVFWHCYCEAMKLREPNQLVVCTFCVIKMTFLILIIQTYAKLIKIKLLYLQKRHGPHESGG